MESVQLDTEYLLDDGPKGKYYKFEATANGSVVLKPVKIPAHVLEERRARIRRKQIERRVQHNREQAAIMNVGFVAFMAVAILICCVVCYFYISLQGEVTTRLRTVASLQSQIEQVSTDNDLREKRIGVQEDITYIREEATETLGMQAMSPEQIVYYSVSDADYMLQYDEIE